MLRWLWGVSSEEADVAAVVEVGVAEEDGFYVWFGPWCGVYVGWDEVRAIEVDLGDHVEVDEVVDASVAPLFEELLVVFSVSGEVHPEVEEYASALLLEEDLVAADCVGAVENRDRSHLYKTFRTD